MAPGPLGEVAGLAGIGVLRPSPDGLKPGVATEPVGRTVGGGGGGGREANDVGGGLLLLVLSTQTVTVTLPTCC